MAAKKRKKSGVFHEAIQRKTQKKNFKEASQTKRREEELLHEYRSLRKSNAFLDRRMETGSKRTKADRFILDDPDTFGATDTLGLTSTDPLLLQPRDDTSTKTKKENPLAKYKQARAEHVAQVQEDMELFRQLDETFETLKKAEVIDKMEWKPNAQQGIALEKEDIEFNEYLTLFSLPSTSEPRKSVSTINRGDQEKIPLLKRIHNVPASEQSVELEEMMSDAEQVDPQGVALCETPSEKSNTPVQENIGEEVQLANSNNVNDAADSQSLDSSSEMDPYALSIDKDSVEMMRDEDQIILSNGHSPVSREEFRDMVKKCTTAGDLNNMITRFREQVSKRNVDGGAGGLQVLFESLFECFKAEACGEVSLNKLDILTQHITQLIQVLEKDAWTTIKNKIEAMNLDFSEKQFANWQGAWPPLSDILCLKLILNAFPVSPAFHPISHSVVLLLCRYLYEGCCCTRHAKVMGLYIASLLEDALCNRFCPELLFFYTEQLRDVLKEEILEAGVSEKKESAPFTFKELIESPETSYFEQRIVFTCIRGVCRLSKNYRKAVCFPEIFSGVTSLIEKLSRFPNLSAKRRDLCQEVSRFLKTSIVDCAANREPLNRSGSATIGIQQRNPVFEERTSFDEIRKWKENEMMDRRTLKKKLNKERRGAIKELRKDGAFLAQIREEDKKKVDKERLKSEKSFYSELRRFDDDMRQGGQAGMNPHLKTKKTRLWRY